jgi:hypothetical protein
MPAILEALRAVVGDLETSIVTVDVALQALYQISGGLIDLTEAIPSTESTEELQISLTGLAGEVRGLAVDLSQVSDSTAPVSEDTVAVSEDLAAISNDLRGFVPLIDQYIAIVGDVRAGIEATQDDLPRIARTVNLVIIVLMVWLGVLHLAPLVEGWELVARRRERERESESTDQREGEPAKERMSE